MTGHDVIQGESETEHAHRWRIEPQGTTTSLGACACGAERVFQNAWGGGNPSWYGAGRGGRRAVKP